jgi:hypothetical protein
MRAALAGKKGRVGLSRSNTGAVGSNPNRGTAQFYVSVFAAISRAEAL